MHQMLTSCSVRSAILARMWNKMVHCSLFRFLHYNYQRNSFTQFWVLLSFSRRYKVFLVRISVMSYICIVTPQFVLNVSSCPGLPYM